MFSGRTAAWVHGLDVPTYEPVEVTLPVACGIGAGARCRATDLPGRRRGGYSKCTPNTELVSQALDVPFGCTCGDGQAFRDLGIGQALPDKGSHVELAPAEA